MKKQIMLIIMVTLVFKGKIYSQTSSSGTSRSSGGTTLLTTERKELTEEDIRAKILSVINSTIGSKLRHPDPKVRKQALTYLVSLLGTSGIFNTTGTTSGTSSTQTVSLVGVQFISDLFLLLNDSDPEVSDLSRVALDVLFGTEDTFLKYMEDPDPTIRKYAIRIYTERSITARSTQDTTTQDRGYINQLFALRTLLVRLKYEKDEGTRKTLTDAIEQILSSTSTTGETKKVRSVDQTILNYLNDENPDVRKNALKIIASMEYNPAVLNILLDKLKVEKDEEVKAEIERTIEVISGGFGREVR